MSVRGLTRADLADPPPPPTIVERFSALVDRSAGPDACWPWRGRRESHGRSGIFVIRPDRKVAAHRVAWVLAYGAIPDAYWIRWRREACRSVACCNPMHLEHAPALPPRAVLDGAAIAAIRERLAAGESPDDLARCFGISRGHARKIGRHWCWKREGESTTSNGRQHGCLTPQPEGRIP